MAIIDTLRMDLKNNDGYFVSIKSLCFESGFENYEPGQKHSSFYKKSPVAKWSYFIPFSNYSIKIVNTCPFYNVLLTHMVKYNNS